MDPEFEQLLESVRERSSHTGLITADRYFREVEGCFNGGFCPVKMVGTESGDQWSKALKEAESKLTYTNKPMRIVRKSEAKRNIKQTGTDGIMRFDAVVTTTMRDRDGDILESSGAKLDTKMPLLWQHMSMAPIGRYIRTLKRAEDEVRARYVIADTELGRDAATLIKLKALRISHGFMPEEFKLLEDEEGWHFTKFLIYETSVVSIPSNVQAVITSVSKSKWASSLVKGMAERMNPSPQTQVPVDIGGPDETFTLEGKTVDPDGETKDKTDDSVETRSLSDIEQEYMAHLAVADTDVLRKAHRRIGLVLKHAEDQEAARETSEIIDLLTSPTP